MAAPILAAATKWAAKQAVKKGAQKVASSSEGTNNLIKYGALILATGSTGFTVLVAIIVGITLITSLINFIGGAASTAFQETQQCDVGASGQSELALSDIPPIALDAYLKAGKTTGIDWAYMAAIGKVETDHGRYGGSKIYDDGIVKPAIIGMALNGSNGTAAIRDTDNGKWDRDTTWDHAIGPMQFIPSTWKGAGKDGDFDGIKDPHNIYDATLSTAFNLKANGAPGDMDGAIFAYNHATWYVAEVMDWYAKYSAATVTAVASPQIGGTITVAHANIPMRSGLGGFRASMPKVLAHNPDFVSLNEMFGKTTAQAEAASPGYTAFRDTRTVGGIGSNQATDQIVMWKTADWEFVTGARIKIVEDDVTLYNGNPATWDRFATWVTLKRKSDGALASMISAHHMTNPGKFGPNRPRRRAAYGEGMNILLAQAGVLAAEGPVFVAGDMNVHASQQGAWTVTEKMTKGGYGWRDYNVDYVFYPKGSGVTMTESWNGPMVSDHNWVAAKFNMGTKGAGGRPFPASAHEHDETAPVAPGSISLSTNTLLRQFANADDAIPGWVQPMKEGTFTYTATFGQAGSSWGSGYHTGLDFGAPTGTPVYAVADGTVTNDTSQSWAGPNLLTIDHGTVDGQPVVTWYAHLSAMEVSSGPVKAGDLIGYVGELGNASGAHLHFEVHVGAGGYYDTDVDPMIWLASAGAPTGGSTGACGPTGDSGVVGPGGEWGGYENGKIPLDAMCKLSFYNTYLECTAAQALESLNTDYQAEFGTSIGPVGGYRSYEAQVAAHASNPSMTAEPGTSNHGWALAVDLQYGLGKISTFGTPAHNWMVKHAADYGWAHPEWARKGGGREEPWHWEYIASGMDSSKT